ncbi:MAG: prolyl oligopeptidase family serine peptidase, partial [Rhodospirillales bacterium]|nr:prolyl oligopeptidase family serine peptidase [Rhodospirillales bacterium]
DVGKNRRISAGDKYLRAAIYFMTAERMGKSNSPERLVTYKRMLRCFELGTQNLQAPVTKVQVPFQDTFLPALFYQAQNVTDNSPAPCIIHFDGLDVMKEYLYLTGLSAQYARRGISTLLLDHPGVGEALRLQDLKLTPNTEEPASAAVDYLESRADIDANKIGIAGISLGGYYAPRAAGFESRLNCVVAWGSINDYGTITRGRLDGSGTNLSVSHWEEHMHWVLGTSTREEIISFTDEMVLDEALANIRCPLLILHGENDRQIPVAMAKKTAAGAVNSPAVELKIFTEEEGGVEHCQVDHSSLAIEYMADWVADVFND